MATPLPENECRFTIEQIVNATKGTARGEMPALTKSVSTDTRTLKEGALFVALIGERFDGHDHIERAFEAGAALAVVKRGTVTSRPVVEVDDTLVALGELASEHFSYVRSIMPLDFTVIAIGGSAGKTTTKELVAAACRAAIPGGTVFATPGNLNNRIGVPHTLFAVEHVEYGFAVIECGTNAPGEIDAIGRIVQPEVSVVVNAGMEHTEGLGTIEAVVAEETAIFGHTQWACITTSHDPALVARLPTGIDPRGMTFGEADGDSVRVKSVTLDAGSARTLVTLDIARSDAWRSSEPRLLSLALRLPGRHAALNAAAAVAAVLVAASPHCDLDAVARALGEVQPVPGRFAPYVTRDMLVIDDTYNANPVSVSAALETAAEIARTNNRRLVVALGDMLELGTFANDSHAAVGRELIASGAALFVAVGTEMRTAAALTRAHGVETRTFDSSTDAVSAFAELLRAGDVVLVKGSRGMRMEKLLPPAP